MRNWYIETYDHENNQLLGSDFTTIVRNCSYSGKKWKNAIENHNKKLENLKEIHPILKLGWTLESKKMK